MSIAAWPESEQPRERLLNAGPNCLSDAELLALCLGSGTRGQSALDLARQLMAQFDGIAGLLAADPVQLQSVAGMGNACVACLSAIWELYQRILLEQVIKRDVLTSSAATRKYLKARFLGCQHEVFSCLFLNNQHHVVTLEELFRGTIDGAAVYPREVVKRCLHYNAAAVIFAHNHPSGVAEPSQADIAITKKLTCALQTIDVRVLDHLVIGAAGVLSFAERGLIESGA